MKPGIRILIVEDNAADAELAEYTLKSAGFDLISKVVETKGEYLSALSDFSPDIILSDYDMPMFNGADALDLLKEIRPDLPFILYTGAMGEERAIEILTSGATDYVMKNRLLRLVPAVERALAEVEAHKARKKAEAELRESHGTLEAKVKERTAELEAEIAVRKKIEAVLWESEERLHFALESSHTGAWDLDLVDHTAFRSLEHDRIFGYSELLPQWTYEMFLDHVLPEDRSEVDAKFSRAIDTGSGWSFECRIRRTDGEVRWIWATGRHRTNAAGDLHRMAGIVQDITERKLFEEKLRTSEERHRLLAETMLQGVVHQDAGGEIIAMNPAAERILGKSREEFLGSSSVQEGRDTIRENGENFPGFEHPSMVALRTGLPVREVIMGVFNPKLRDYRWISIDAVPVVRPGDVRPSEVYAVFEDITERRQMEEALRKAKDELEIKVQERTSQLSVANMALRQSEEKYRELVESAQSIILRMDRAGNITFINEFAERFFGYSQQEVLGRNVVGTIVPELESSGRDLKALLKDIALNPEKYINNENENMRKNGERVWISWTNAPIHDARGRLLEVLCVGNDITDRKRMEERLRSAQKNLRAMAAEIVMSDERSRQQFAADLHDTVIQTMGAAKMRSQMIQNDIPEKASKEFRELQDFISQSITQARFLMAEMSPPVLNELGFIPALEWLAEQIENQHGINIEFKAADGFTPLQHEIQVLLFQATREVLMNVVKHAKANKALINVSARRQKIRIEVIDNGKGFDKRQAFRADVSSGGFGLFSIRERIRHFGGHLLIRSEEGKGTRVIMTAPRTWGGIKAKETSR